MRLFVALPVPVEVRAVVASARSPLEAALSNSQVRWQDPANSHLTLRFLGEVAERDLAALRLGVKEAAARTGPFALDTAGYGAFPGAHRPSVLWLGVTGDLAALGRLHGLVTQALALHSFAPAGEFRPHLTLGRIRRLSPEDRERLAEVLGSAPPAGASWRVSSVQLIESRLRPQGASYEVLVDAPLSGNPGSGAPQGG